MRHYHKNKYVKKKNLFFTDAVKSLDTSGARYDTFTWNNIRDLRLYGDCKMKIGSLDFDTFVSEQVATADIQAPVPPDNLVVYYVFDGDVYEEVQNTPTNIIGTEVYGVGKKLDNNAFFNASWACSIDAANNPLTSVTNAITFCAWIKLYSLVRELTIRKDFCYSLRIGSNGTTGFRVVMKQKMVELGRVLQNVEPLAGARQMLSIRQRTRSRMDLYQYQ